ncbi:hypothetical protein PR048_026528 [Dryococelus australis]|uniref:Uncharacterized protein n=1 Tax=Dryococelus australis TaxID=614101 RepID=A0ABQ9GLJ9_9NEOP|nr:hypothetical protein PR048_026528 [Dryococelus australis]
MPILSSPALATRVCVCSSTGAFAVILCGDWFTRHLQKCASIEDSVHQELRYQAGMFEDIRAYDHKDQPQKNSKMCQPTWQLSPDCGQHPSVLYPRLGISLEGVAMAPIAVMSNPHPSGAVHSLHTELPACLRVPSSARTYNSRRNPPVSGVTTINREVIRDGASCTGKRDWVINGKESAMVLVRDPGVISGNHGNQVTMVIRMAGPGIEPESSRMRVHLMKSMSILPLSKDNFVDFHNIAYWILVDLLEFSTLLEQLALHSTVQGYPELQTTRLSPTRTGFKSRRAAPGFSRVGIVPDDVAGRRGFSGSPVSSVLAFRRCSIRTSLLRPQDLDVKIRPNLSTPSLHLADDIRPEHLQLELYEREGDCTCVGTVESLADSCCTLPERQEKRCWHTSSSHTPTRLEACDITVARQWIDEATHNRQRSD